MPGPDGLTPTMRKLMKERNFKLSLVTFEFGRVLRMLNDWKASLAKYKQSKELMEKAGMDGLDIYKALLEELKVAESKAAE